MTTVQRIIKYCAIAFAIFIIVSIVSSILFGLNTFSEILGFTRKERKPETSNVIHSEVGRDEKTEKEFDNTQIAKLSIDIEYATLTIQQGDKFKVASNTSNIEAKQTEDQLVIREKNVNLFRQSNPRRIIVTVPRNTILDTIKIDAGAGEINIEKLECKKLDLAIGAGRTTIQDLNITQKTKIEGGAGKVEILSGEIANLDLDMGVGTFKLVSSLAGDSKINAGVGKLEMILKNGLDKYTIKTNKGIGSITVDGKQATDGATYGRGENNIKVEGGIGSITIK